MSERKLNKSEAGYHMLQLLAMVDDSFSVNEDLIIRKYLVENYPFHVSLDGAMEQISMLAKEDYIIHFQKNINEFNNRCRINFIYYSWTCICIYV